MKFTSFLIANEDRNNTETVSCFLCIIVGYLPYNVNYPKANVVLIWKDINETELN